MNALLSTLFVLALTYCTTDAGYERKHPKVQVYSRDPSEFGKNNVLICHVDEFSPPDITIELVKDGVELPGAQQTDLAFNSNWLFHLTRSVNFNPNSGENYVCRIRHGGTISNFEWESNM